MPEFDRTCFRLACLLQQGICRLQTSAASHDASQCTFRQHDLGHCQHLFHKLEKARSRHLDRAAATVASDLENALHLLRERLAGYLAHLGSRAAAPVVPSLRSLYSEVLGLSEEFDKTHFDLKEGLIVVITEPIELEDVYLGEFEIQLHLDGLGKPHPYEVIAVDPHPAAADEVITHPHVRDKRLCEGDGRVAIRQALATGRLADFFQVVNQVLHSYNAGSAHAQLNEWFDIPCADCDDMTSQDSAYACLQCGKQLCGECAWECRGCLGHLCSACGQACPKCRRRFCDVCLHECAECEDQFCPSCLSNSKCQDCHDRDPSRNEPRKNEPCENEPRENELSPHEPAAGHATEIAFVPPAAGEADLAVQSAGLGQTPVSA